MAQPRKIIVTGVKRIPIITPDNICSHCKYRCDSAGPFRKHCPKCGQPFAEALNNHKNKASKPR